MTCLPKRLGRALLLAVALGSAMPPGVQGRELVSSDADLVQALLPAVVNIVTRKPESAQSAAWKTYYGSGFIIASDGLILTNRHVVDGARQLIVGFNDGTRALGTVVAAPPEIDIALIKVTTDHVLPMLKLGDSDRLRIGDSVLAIGNPLGIGTSVSAGIVSALNRDIKDGPYDDFIQTDAAINHGNSGGPLVDAAGEVVGVDSDIYSDVDNGGSIGLGFALTINDVKFVLDRLRRFGRVKAGWIGVGLQDMDPMLAREFGHPGLTGAVVTAITPGSPAADAGIRSGDVIMRVNDATPADARGTRRAIGTVPAGEELTLQIWHGAERTVRVRADEIPGTLQAPTPPGSDANSFATGGLRLSPMTEAARQTYALATDQPGVLVTGVDNDVFTGEHLLLPGDVILQVQDTPVTTPDDVLQQVDLAGKAGKGFVVLLVKGSGGQSWLPLRISAMVH